MGAAQHVAALARQHKAAPGSLPAPGAAPKAQLTSYGNIKQRATARMRPASAGLERCQHIAADAQKASIQASNVSTSVRSLHSAAPGAMSWQARRDVQAALADDPGLRMALALQADDAAASAGTEQSKEVAAGDLSPRCGSLSMRRRARVSVLQPAGASYVADWKQG